MMPTIRSKRFAGKQVWLGDGLVAFGDDGVAIGVINRGGEPIRPPAPPGPSQVEAAYESPSYEVLGDENIGVPDSDATPPATDEAVADESVPEADGQEDVPDLDAMTRAQLYRYATEELGLKLDWKGTTADEFRAAIRAALGISDEPAGA